MGIGYQDSDRHVIDYDLWFADNGKLAFRGPPPANPLGVATVFLGAAQTFGRFVTNPFPNEVARFTGKPSLNLGISGAGAETYLRSDFLRSQVAVGSGPIDHALAA